MLIQDIINIRSFGSESDKKGRCRFMDNLKKALKDLAHQIDLIKSNRDAIKKETKQNFNVFTAVLAAHDETRLHSRFITYLLNPNANHDCGKLFLKSFIDTLIERKDVLSLNEDQIKALNDIKDDNVKCSKATTEKNANRRRIDIYLDFEDKNEKYKIAIENKIYAYEQVQQIADYAEFINSRESNNFLFYLTLDGKESYTAENTTTGQIAEYFSISYREHILAWLEKCLRATYKYPNINQVIQQYQNVVKQLTYQTLEDNDMEKIKEIIKANPGIIKYQNDINNAVEKIKKDFIESIQATLTNKGYTVTNSRGRKGLYIDIINKITKKNRTVRIRYDSGNPLVIGLLAVKNPAINETNFKILNTNTEIFNFCKHVAKERGQGWAFYVQYDWYDILQTSYNFCDLIDNILQKIS